MNFVYLNMNDSKLKDYIIKTYNARFPSQVIKYIDDIQGEKIQIAFISLENNADLEKIKQLKEKNVDIEIIILSNQESLIFETQQYEILYFIRCNNLEEDTMKALVTLEKKINSKYLKLTIESNKHMFQIYIDSIQYIESFGHYLYIYCHYGKFKVRENISNIIDTLTPHKFIQIHRSYIVKMDAIVSMRSKEIQLIDGTSLPVGRTYKEKAINSFKKYNNVF